MLFTRKFFYTVCSLAFAVNTVGAAHADALFVGGDWTCNFGKVRVIPPVTPGNWKITIDQAGASLILVDENGKRSGGRIFDTDTLSATDWLYGKRGYVGMGLDGTFYRYKDAVQNFNLRPDMEWNFIRWDGGAICVRSK